MQTANKNTYAIKNAVVYGDVAKYIMYETREDGRTYSGSEYTVAELAAQFKANEQANIVALLRELNARGVRKYAAKQLVRTSMGWYTKKVKV